MNRYIVLLFLAVLLLGGISSYLLFSSNGKTGANKSGLYNVEENQDKALLGGRNDRGTLDKALLGAVSTRLSQLEEKVSECKDTQDKILSPDHQLTTEEIIAREERQMAEADELERRTYERYEETMNSDSFDPVWNDNMQHKMDDVLQDDLLRNAVDHNFKCKSIMCKLETTHKDEGTQEAFMGSVVGRIMSNGNDIDGIWFKKENGDSGVKNTNIFIFKKGHMREVENSI
jgi:hypothetical protein